MKEKGGMVMKVKVTMVVERMPAKKANLRLWQEGINKKRPQAAIYHCPADISVPVIYLENIPPALTSSGDELLTHC